MIGLLAILRPSDWELPLFLHVLGAMLLVGTLVVAVTALVFGWRAERGGTLAFDRLGFWALVASIPAWLLMRIPAQWVWDVEGYDDAAEEPGWMLVGIVAAELGGILLLLTTVASAIALRRSRQRDDARRLIPRLATVIAALLLLAYIVAVWAMTAKPD